MHYNQSTQILEEVKKANRILLNCHKNPDPDSIGSALAMKSVLEDMGKEIKVICPTKIDKGASFLNGFDQIEIVNFDKFDFKDFDLFIVLDSATWEMVVGEDTPRTKEVKIIVIDHHFTNDNFGDINLVDPKVTSASELLCRMLSDWGIEVKDNAATSILTGIISDTGAFRYSGVSKETLKLAADLISNGADKEKIIYNIFNNLEVNLLKLVGEMIEKMEVDKKSKFCWCAVPLDLYEKYGKADGAKEYAANTFIQSVTGTNFGMIMVETEVKKLSVSLRSRGTFDVSQIALELGGGGHKAAAGVTVSGIVFEDAVEKVLKTAREIANENPA